MSDKVFIDSNLLIYSVSTEMSKRIAVESLFQKNYEFVISIQVVNEFSNVCFKKNLLSTTDLEKLVNGFFAFFKVSPIEASTILLAYSIKSRYGFSYYDALIVATALESKCTLLFSEDLQHNQLIENILQIKNPFIP